MVCCSQRVLQSVPVDTAFPGEGGLGGMASASARTLRTETGAGLEG